MRIGLISSFVLASAFAASFTLSASAQPPTSAIGEVLETEGPEGSIVVVRGAGVYSLATGDTLFAGDRIFTRSNATVKLRANGCERDLPKATSIEIGDDFCRVTLVSLGESEMVEGVTVLAQGTPVLAGVGATAGIVALLATGGAAAAAATAEASTANTPVS
jgi:hypothetical protein